MTANEPFEAVDTDTLSGFAEPYLLSRWALSPFNRLCFTAIRTIHRIIAGTNVIRTIFMAILQNRFNYQYAYTHIDMRVNIILDRIVPVCITSAMKPIEHIRRDIFAVSQATFAEIAGTTQPSVSRWEQGVQEPCHSEMERIRLAAVRRGLRWNDRWFFEMPKRSRDK